MFFFFFSSRRRHTRSLCDWSSDVCSSDLLSDRPAGQPPPGRASGAVVCACELFRDRDLEAGLERDPDEVNRVIGRLSAPDWARDDVDVAPARDRGEVFVVVIDASVDAAAGVALERGDVPDEPGGREELQLALGL